MTGSFDGEMENGVEEVLSVSEFFNREEGDFISDCENLDYDGYRVWYERNVLGIS